VNGITEWSVTSSGAVQALNYDNVFLKHDPKQNTFSLTTVEKDATTFSLDSTDPHTVLYHINLLETIPDSQTTDLTHVLVSLSPVFHTFTLSLSGPNVCIK
jgi:hypothetical protein